MAVAPNASNESKTGWNPAKGNGLGLALPLPLHLSERKLMSDDLLKKVISHAKEYGFVFPSSEIYDGLSAAYDYGQLGAELKNNIKQYWWTAMVRMHENIVGIDASIFMHPTTWKASSRRRLQRPLIDNKDSKRYRADVLIEDHIAKMEGKSTRTL